MGIEKVVSTVYVCDRCRHSWRPRKGEVPKVCPACKRTTWNAGGAPEARAETASARGAGARPEVSVPSVGASEDASRASDLTYVAEPEERAMTPAERIAAGMRRAGYPAKTGRE